MNSEYKTSEYRIIPRVDVLEDGTYRALIRRYEYLNEQIISKSVLSPVGNWVNIPEGNEYPKECFIRSATFARGDANRRVYNWPRSSEIRSPAVFVPNSTS